MTMRFVLSRKGRKDDAAISDPNSDNEESREDVIQEPEFLTQPPQKESIPFTSTPFVRHKKAPEFEISSIISPVDVTDSQPDALQPGDKEVTLKVNKRGRGGSKDDVFDQLLHTDTKISKQPSANIPCDIVPPVKSQADTTRHYAGGAVKNRLSKQRDLSDLVEDPDSSWVTASTSPIANPSESPINSQKVSSTNTNLDRFPHEEVKGPVAFSNDETTKHHSTNITDEKVTKFVNAVISKKHQSGEDAVKVSTSTVKSANNPSIMTRNLRTYERATSTKQTQMQERECSRKPESIKQRIINNEGKEPKADSHESSEREVFRTRNRIFHSPCQRKTEVHLQSPRGEPFSLFESPENNFLQTDLQKDHEETNACVVSTSTVPSELKKSENVASFEEENVLIENKTCHERVAIPSKSGTGRNKISEGQNLKQSSGCEVAGSASGKQVTKVTEEKECPGSDRATCQRPGMQAINKSHSKDVGTSSEDQSKHNNQLEATNIPKKQGNYLLRPHENSCDVITLMGMNCHFSCQIGKHHFTQASQFAILCNQKKAISKIGDLGSAKSVTSDHIDLQSKDAYVVDSSPFKSKEAGDANGERVQSETKNIESSSEEERQVLRAQSLKLRGKQGQSSGNCKVAKVHGIKPLHLNIENENTSSSPIITNSKPKHSQKSPSNERRQSARRRREEQYQALSIGESSDEDVSQVRKMKSSCNIGSKFHNGNLSTSGASENHVYISRNPSLMSSESPSEDQLDLEIASSSSDEEVHSKKIHAKQNKHMKQSKATPEKGHEIEQRSKNGTKGRRLSFTARKLRQRKENLIASRQDSSPCDSPKPKTSYKRRRVHSRTSDGTKYRDADSIDGDLSNVSSSQDEVVNNRKHPKSTELFEESPGNPSNEGIVSERSSFVNDKDMKSVKKSPEAPLLLEKRKNGTERKDVNNSSNKVLLRKEQKRHNKNNANDIQTLIHQNENERKPDDNPAVNLKGTNELKKTQNQNEARNVKKMRISPESKKQKRKNNTVKAQQKVIRKRSLQQDINEGCTNEISKDSHVQDYAQKESEENTGFRSSKRVRLPPTLYWLGQRVKYKVLDNGCKEVVKVSPAIPHTQLSESAKQQSQLKALKRKARTSNKPVKTRKKMEADDLQIADSENLDHLSPEEEEEEEVLICEAGSMPRDSSPVGSSQRDDAQMETEAQVQLTKCVKGYGLGGDLVVLYEGAKLNEQKSTQLKKMFYVLEGEVLYHSHLNEKKLKAGSFFIVAQGQEYEISNNSDILAKLLMFSCKT